MFGYRQKPVMGKYRVSAGRRLKGILRTQNDPTKWGFNFEADSGTLRRPRKLIKAQKNPVASVVKGGGGF
jgi:hypothetical protein